MSLILSDAGVRFNDASLQASAAAPQIVPIGATVASSALTITSGELSLAFRSTTLGSGAVTYVTGTPANLVVPSTATLGTVSGQQSRLVVLALNNAGTIELAVVNIAGGNDLSETGLISTTAIAAASNSASTVYSTTARTSVAYRVLGYIESTQTTAGTWATAPSTIQGVGGQALTAMSSLGYGQTWQNVNGVGGRASGVTLYNTSGKPIVVWIYSAPPASASIVVVVGGNTLGSVPATNAYGAGNAVVIVPAGTSYNITASTITTWYELR
jgi:hypothetical protein